MTVVEQSVVNLTERSQEAVIERCGRICYNSVDKIDKGSEERFVKNVIKNGHTSVLEHSAITLAVPSKIFYQSYLLLLFEPALDEYNELKFFQIFTNVKGDSGTEYVIITANCRAWYNWLEKESSYFNTCKESFKYAVLEIADVLKEISPSIFGKFESFAANSPLLELTEYGLVDWYSNNISSDNALVDFWKKNCCIYAFELTTSRYTQNQLVRHRCAHFSVQSQRYCNYSIDKFDNNVKFVINAPTVKDKTILENFAAESEMRYFQLLEQGAKPEDARLVLPNMTATVMAMSATKPEWESVFALRCDSHAQQEVRDLCNMIKQELEKACN